MLDSIDNLGEGAITALVQMWGEVAGFVPNLAGAMVILVVGYVAARVAGSVVRRLLAAVGFDRLSERAGLAAVLDRMNVSRTASGILGRIVFWILLLVFLLSASESLGLDRLSATIDSLVQYLPRVLGAVFILAIGLFAATFARDAVRAAAANIGSEHANTLGHATYGLLAVISVALAIGQLELESGLLTVAVGIVMTAAGVAAALAFGLGSREVAANVLAGAYLRDNFPPGTRIAVEGTAGEVKAVEALATVVVTGDGDVSVPNMLLVRGTVRIGAASDEHREGPES
ncbi:MAG: mechanosensitive ion channel [Gammaproteobacteria bacterium]|nr:mechanosensitive ion channel [Gammaproteobacteria bacterium]MDE0440989.1 mechanosensitive ion channel [Gammaproteobacteria bacterium]